MVKLALFPTVLEQTASSSLESQYQHSPVSTCHHQVLMPSLTRISILLGCNNITRAGTESDSEGGFDGIPLHDRGNKLQTVSEDQVVHSEVTLPPITEQRSNGKAGRESTSHLHFTAPSQVNGSPELHQQPRHQQSCDPSTSTTYPPTSRTHTAPQERAPQGPTPP